MIVDLDLIEPSSLNRGGARAHFHFSSFRLFFFNAFNMIDLCQWRARIGSWNCCNCSQSQDCFGSKSSTSHRAGLSNTISSTQGKAPKLILSIFCLAILLFISGDVELNPGPTLTGILIFIIKSAL